MSLSKADIEIIKQLIHEKPNATMEDLVNTQPKQSPADIPKILAKMSPAELKKQFGTNIYEYKFVGIKDFMTKNNIQTGTKWQPSLTYENKHFIIEKCLKSENKKQQTTLKNKALKTLKDKLANPPKTLYGKPPSEKQLSHIQNNIKAEIGRWG